MSVPGADDEDGVPFSVAHNELQGSAILDKLRQQKDAGRFCDVVFHVQDHMYAAHRNVLAACSPYFDSVLKTNKVAKEHLTVQCHSQDVFKALLDYMYTGNLVIARHRVPELLRLANHFLIEQLKQGCLEFLERNISAANCFSIREQVERCGCQSLVHTVESFILCNIGEIVRHGEVLEFTYSKLEQLISSKSYMLTENQRIALIIHWVAHCITGRTRYFRKLLTHVRWQTVNLHQVYELIQQNVLFQTSEYCLFHMLQVLQSNNLLWTYYAETLAQLSAKLSEMTGLDQEALVKLAIAGAFDATTETPAEGSHGDDGAIISQSVEDDTTALHRAADAELADSVEPTSDTSLTETYGGTENTCVGEVRAEIQAEMVENKAQTMNEEELKEEDLLPEGGDADGTLSGDTSFEDRKEDSAKQRRKRKGIPSKVATKKLQKETQSSSPPGPAPSQKGVGVRRRGRPPKGVMQYSSKLKKNPAQNTGQTSVKSSGLTSAEHSSKRTGKNSGQTSVKNLSQSLVQVVSPESTESEGNSYQGGRVKTTTSSSQEGGGVQTVDESGDVKNVKSETGTNEEELSLLTSEDVVGSRSRTPGEQETRESGLDPYKCDTDNENEADDVTPASNASKQRLGAIKRRGKVSGATNSTAKKSRLKLVRKAIAKVKGEKLRTVGEKQKCGKCDYVGLSVEKLEVHERKAHKDNTVYQCTVCDFSCAWNREYYKHMKIHFQGPPYECDFEACDYVVDRIQPLLYHRMVHTDERPFQCTVCNMSFRTRNNLTTHLKCHTGQKDFVCKTCGKKFAAKAHLSQHVLIHLNRRFLCDVCGFTTKVESHLKSHRRIHTGDVFKCTYAGCNYFTPKRSQLGAHMRVHLSIRSHICSVCGRAFVEKSHLVRHERIHLTEKPFKCTQCDYGSTRRDKLKEHITKHHGETPTAKSPYKPRKQRKVPVDAQNLLPNRAAQQYPHSMLQQGQMLEMHEQLLRQEQQQQQQQQQQSKEETPVTQVDLTGSRSSQVSASTAAMTSLDAGPRFGLVLPTVVSVPPTSVSSTITPSHQEAQLSSLHPHPHPQLVTSGAHPPGAPTVHPLTLTDAPTLPVQDLILHPHPHHPQQLQQQQQQAQLLQQPVMLSSGQHDITTLQTFSNLMGMWQ